MKHVQARSQNSTSTSAKNVASTWSKSRINLELVDKMQVASAYIFKSNTITIFKLVSLRSIKLNEKDLEKLKQKIIISKKNEQLNLFSNNHLSLVKRQYLIEMK